MAERGTDVLVIGGGAAGVLAAAAARERGKRACLLARSVGASAVSSGAVDLAGDPRANPQRPLSERTDIQQNLEAILEEELWHPYQQVACAFGGPKEKARDVIRRFEAVAGILVEKGGLALEVNARENRARFTGLGTFKFTAAGPQAAGSFAAAELENLQACFVDFPGLPGQLASRQASVFDSIRGHKGAPSASVSVTLAEALGPNASAVGLASLFDDGDFAAKAAKLVAAALPSGAGVAVLPPVLGIERSKETAAIFRAALPIPFVETLAVPPSPAGVRLNLALEEILSRSGVEIVHGEAAPVEGRSGRLESLNVRLSGGADMRISFKTAVLATGKFIGGGLRKEERIRETLFDLPVTWRGRPFNSRINEEIFNTRYLGRQPAFEVGVQVDGSLRPVGAGGDPVFENLHAAGAVLGGFDSAAGPAGLGLALVTGWAAGDQAGGGS